MTIAKILPLAFVMIAGPQILTAIFLATSEEWRQNSAAYVAGAALSITATITASYFLSTGATGQGSSDDTLYIVVIVLLVFAAIHTFSPGRPPNRRNGWAAIPNTRMISCVVFMAARCYAICEKSTRQHYVRARPRNRTPSAAFLEPPGPEAGR